MLAGGFEHVARTHVGCRRELNEDAVLEFPSRGLWAIADGMGGHEAGDIASGIVVEELSSCPAGSDDRATVDNALILLERANLRLVDLARSKFKGRTIGSTVVGLVLNDRRFTCFWAGDSRAYRVRGNAIERLTKDHSMVQDLVDAGMLGEAEAEAHPQVNIITRAIGVSDALDVEVVSGDVRPGDVFLLASDGLTRLVGDDELRDELRNDDLEESASRLLQMALDRQAPDNVSLALIRRRPPKP